MSKRKSSQVTLALVSTGLLSACGTGPEYVRDHYRTKEECRKDWEDRECDRRISTSSTYYGGRYFYSGPQYDRRYRHRKARANNAVKTITTTSSSSTRRSGFGSGARSFFSSGG